MSDVRAVDPPGCGCTECLTGEYIPLDQASEEQLVMLLRGELRDNTGLPVMMCAVGWCCPPTGHGTEAQMEALSVTVTFGSARSVMIETPMIVTVAVGGAEPG